MMLTKFMEKDIHVIIPCIESQHVRRMSDAS